MTFAILPMKSPGTGKTRLDSHFTASERAALATAMFADVLIALSRATLLTGVIVVSGDTDVAETAALHGASWIDDASVESHSEAALLGINHAIELGAARVLLVPGDCPSITPDEIDSIVSSDTANTAVGVLPDRHGTGTNGLLLVPPDAIEPAFGNGSRDRHLSLAEAAGAAAVIINSPGFQLDVDTPEDIEALAAHLQQSKGAAVNTRAVLSQRKVLSRG
jgi:2-phospho-L-lactate guanylyltransferase